MNSIDDPSNFCANDPRWRRTIPCQCDIHHLFELTSRAMMSESNETPPEPEFSKEELRLAMKAFRKRLKLIRLDDESRLGYGPMSSGNKSSVAAIRPPDQYPIGVWRLLAEQGKLRRDGGGLYS